MKDDNARICAAFAGFRLIAEGELEFVALATKKVLESSQIAQVLIFDDATGEQVEVDFRGTVDDVCQRLLLTHSQSSVEGTAKDHLTESPRRPGRPRLGVVAREVTLLPRHWEWLNTQPGGASVALRKLVEHARRANEETDRVRRAQEATYRVMSALAGNLPGFEEALRALFALDSAQFALQISGWPDDVRKYLTKRANEIMSFDREAEPIRSHS